MGHRAFLSYLKVGDHYTESVCVWGGGQEGEIQSKYERFWPIINKSGGQLTPCPLVRNALLCYENFEFSAFFKLSFYYRWLCCKSRIFC